jgi:hypothetical protein
MSDDFDYTPLQVLLLAVLAVGLMMLWGCTQHSSGTVVYLDDSGRPYACQDQSGLLFPPTQGHCRLEDALNANP